MLTIRQVQIAALGNEARLLFEREMVAHAKTFAPELTRVAGDANLATAVHTGLDRAAGYGLTLRGPVRLYVELMLTFGSDFDSDPVLAWMKAPLEDTGRDQLGRALDLFGLLGDYRIRVAGLRDEAAVAALRRTRALRLDMLEDESEPLEDAILWTLRRVYPDKCEVTGQRALDALVARGIDEADTYRLTARGGPGLLTGLMFGFGHGVATDPLYPWVAATLRDRRILNAAARTARLHRKVNAYLDRILARLPS